MKTIIPLTIAAAFVASGIAQAQTPAFSTPAGYVSTQVAGNVANSPGGAATFVSPALVEPTVFSGAAASSPSGTKVVNFASAVGVVLDGTYLLEISDGASEGWWTTVVSTSGSQITVFDDFPSDLAADVSLSVRKFTTIKSWLGDNEPGLTVAVDQVTVLDPMTQVVTPLAYVTTAQGAPQDGWFDLSGPTAADDLIVYPGTAVKFVRFAATPLTVVGTGHVKTTKTQVDIYPRDNWIDTGLAIGKTLGSVDLKGQLIPIQSNGNTDFDQIVKIFPDQSAVPFAVVADGVAPFDIADLSDSSDASAEPFDSATGVVLRRDPSIVKSTVTFPAQTIGQ